MRRLNIKDAFVGEPTGAADSAEREGDEAVVLAIRGGQVVAVVPPGTPDDRVLDRPTLIRGELRLENGRLLEFAVHEGATGAFHDTESIDLHRRREASGAVGLSSIGGGSALTETGKKRAREVMTTDLICTGPETSVQELARLLAFHNVSALPILDADGRVVGVASEADVIARRGATVADIMSRDLVVATEDDTLESIAQQMAQRRVKRVLIMRGDQLVGLVSRADLVHALAGI